LTSKYHPVIEAVKCYFDST